MTSDVWCWFAVQVMAQVSCEIMVPKDSRPNEGSLLINVELSPMAAPHFEAGRRSDEAVCVIFMCIFTVKIQLSHMLQLFGIDVNFITLVLVHCTQSEGLQLY